MSFGADIAANAIGGAIVVVLAYVGVDHRLRLNEIATRSADERTRRDAFELSVLAGIDAELKFNRAVSARFREHIPQNESVYPGYDTNWATTIRDPSFLVNLYPSTGIQLLNAYSRLESAQALYRDVYSMRHGSLGLSGLIAEKFSETAGEQFVVQRDQATRHFLERVDELAPSLDAAIQAIALEMTNGATARRH